MAQMPPTQVAPGGQGGQPCEMHWPLKHTAPVGQGGHGGGMHCPLTHVVPNGHGGQLGATHCPFEQLVPGGHDGHFPPGTQLPSRQVSRFEHRLPQKPQFPGSEANRTHVVPQSSSPVAQPGDSPPSTTAPP